MNIPRFWLQGGWQAWLLLPLAALFCLLTLLRRQYYRLVPPNPLPVPVIVVGNLTVGGSGKTPVVAALAQHLRARGWQVGIISRGYGGRAPHYPLAVTPTTDPVQAGDEPVLLAQLTACPVVVAPDRHQAACHLLARTTCTVLLSDDGLQHYRLPRDLELVILPETRCGNGYCLPAGPLRESARRLHRVDWVLTRGVPQPNEWPVHLEPGLVWNLADPARQHPLSHWQGQTVQALAGIAYPERFFTLLRAAGLVVLARPFPDHHVYTAADCPATRWPLFMTAKDAVKCARFGLRNAWVVPVTAVLAAAFWQQLEQRLESVRGIR